MAAETFRITEELVVDDKTGAGLASAQRKVSEFDKTVQQTKERLTSLTGSKWSTTFSAVDKATSVITNVESKLHSAVGKAWNFTVGVIDKVTAPLQSIFNMLKNPLLQAGAVLGISLSVSDAISTFGDFESTMSKVQAISGASGSDLENLTNLAKELGATTKFTATEAAEGLTYMAMAGWKTEDMMTSLSGVMNLAAASGEDLATVSDIVTDAMTAFGFAADGVTDSGVSNATHFADVLAAASSNANTTVSGMGDTFKYVGSMAGAMGYSIEDVALATGLMANSGIKGTMAGTALNSMLTRLSTNTSGAADAISALGVEFYNSDGSARNLSDVMGELRKATVNMTAAEKSELANTVAGMEAQKGLLAILNTSEEDYNKLTEAIYNADGAAQQMSDTMLDNMQGSMTLLQSAVDGVKLSLGSRLSPYVRQFADWLTTKMPAVEDIINEVFDSVDGKIETLKETIADFTASDEWANADVWGKLSIAWDKIVAEPFSSWWESTGKPWMTEKVAGIGETLGSGITSGLLAMLGFDASGAVEDGQSIGASFVEGFKNGFDTEQISEALTEWASDHKGLVAAAGLVVGGKLIGGMSKAFQAGKSIVGDVAGLFGKGGESSGLGGLGAFTTSTMTVTAGTVILSGNGAGQAARSAAQAATGGTLSLPGRPAVSQSSPLALPGGPGAAPTAAAGGLTSAGSWLSKILTAGSKSSVIGADGTLLAVQGGVGGVLGSIGGALGTGATTAAGAAAAGLAGGAGILGGIAGLISAGADLFQGFKKSEEGDSKGAKDEFVTAGTKTGMVAAGAGIGAAVGSIVPVIGTGVGAAVGAGIGGIGAMVGGDKAGKAISDSTDEGGWLNNAAESMGNFASLVGEKIGGFFTETIPTFLTEQVPYAAGYVFGAAETFFTQTVPDKVEEMLDSAATFFTESVPTWAENTFQSAQRFFAEDVPQFFTDLWDNVTAFVTETIPTWADESFQKATTFFGETVPGFFDDLWADITGFVTETIGGWGSSIAQKVSGWWGSVSGWFDDIWSKASGAFSAGKEAGSGKHAEGGIMFAPHLAQIAEDGPEAIIPLGASDRSRGMSIWEQVGDILGASGAMSVGSNDNGLGSMPAGTAEMAAESGENVDVPVYATNTNGSAGASELTQDTAINVPVNITLNPEIVIQATAGMNTDDIVQALKDHIRELVDDISDEMAERLARVFANMPVRGGA